MLSFFPRGVLDEILNIIESVVEGFPSYSYRHAFILTEDGKTDGRSRKRKENIQTDRVTNNITEICIQADGHADRQYSNW